VQNELLGAGAGRLDFLVESGALPFGEALGFARHQVGFREKVGSRQVERVL
jgi:hypothetical protein